MKKTLKGFTLVECLVAMAILAIASMTLGAIEATVAKRNNFNHFTNSSLSNQMAYVEKYENLEVVKIASTHTGTTPPSGTNSGTTAYVKLTKGTNSYSFPVDIYVMYSRDTHNVGSNGKDADGNTAAYSQMYAEDDHNLRYKYLVGH